MNFIPGTSIHIVHTFHSSMHAPIVAGLTTSVEIDLVIANLIDPAFNAVLSFILPSRLLFLTNAFNMTRNGEVCCTYCVATQLVLSQFIKFDSEDSENISVIPNLLQMSQSI